MRGTEVPFDPEPSLAALVSAGEIEHVDLVLPMVPNNRETTVYLDQFVAERQEKILWATANPECVDFKPSGESPLHVNLWFRLSAQPDITRLIEELESLGSE